MNNHRALILLWLSTVAISVAISPLLLGCSESTDPAASTPALTDDNKILTSTSPDDSSNPAATAAMFRADSQRTGNFAGGVSSGLFKWQFNTKGQLGSSPAVSPGKVFFSSHDGSLYGVDLSDGEDYWKAEGKGSAKSSPAVAEGIVYSGNSSSNGQTPGALYALDEATGAEKWQFAVAGGVTTAPAVYEGVVYFGGGDGSYYAVDAVSGQKKWSFPTGYPAHSDPAVSDGIVYFGGGWNTGPGSMPDGIDSNLYAVNASTGQEIWRIATTQGAAGTPTVAGGAIYYGGWDGSIHKLDAKNGQQLWSFAPAGNLYPNLAVADGTVYFLDEALKGSFNSLYAIDAQTGREKWKFASSNIMQEDMASGSISYRLMSAPAVSEGVVYFGSLDRNLYAIDVSTGTERWKYATGYRLHTSPAIAGDVVYFAGMNKTANSGLNGGIFYALGGSGAVAEPMPATPATPDIRAVDWNTVIGTNAIVQFGSAEYADLTGDGTEDALVQEARQGSGGFISYYVYSYNGSTLTRLFEQQGVMRGSVRLGEAPGTFVETSGSTTSDYANCCPKDWLITTYKWSASKDAFEIIDESLVPNPEALRIH